MKKIKLITCVICGLLMTSDDMDYEWCNNCLRRHLENKDPNVQPTIDKKTDIKPKENGKRSN